MTELLEVWKDGHTYAMTSATLITELTYANYKYNRQHSPNITPARWVQVFGPTEAMEKRYQQEITSHSSPGVSGLRCPLSG